MEIGKAKSEKRNQKTEIGKSKVENRKLEREAARGRPMSLCRNFGLGSFYPKKAFAPIRTFCPLLRTARFSPLARSTP
jgi:hypothetical protein